MQPDYREWTDPAQMQVAAILCMPIFTDLWTRFRIFYNSIASPVNSSVQMLNGGDVLATLWVVT